MRIYIHRIQLPHSHFAIPIHIRNIPKPASKIAIMTGNDPGRILYGITAKRINKIPKPMMGPPLSIPDIGQLFLSC